MGSINNSESNETLLNSLVLRIMQKIESINKLTEDLFIDEKGFSVFSKNPPPEINFNHNELSHVKIINWLYITYFERGNPNLDCLIRIKKYFDKIRALENLGKYYKQKSKDNWYKLFLERIKNEISNIHSLFIRAINMKVFEKNSNIFIEINEDELTKNSELDIDKHIWNMFSGVIGQNENLFPNYSDKEKYDIINNDDDWNKFKDELIRCLKEYSELHFIDHHKELIYELRTKSFHDLVFEKVGNQKIRDNCDSWYRYTCGNNYPHDDLDYNKSNKILLESSLEYFDEMLSTLELIRKESVDIKNDIINQWKIQRDKYFPDYMYDEIISETAIYFGIENINPKQIRKHNWQKWKKELSNFQFDDVEDIKGSVRAQAVKLVEDYFINDKTIFLPIDSKDILNAFPQDPGPLIGKLLKYSKKLFIEKKCGKEQILKIIKEEVLTDYPESLSQEDEYYQQKIDQLKNLLE